jgi:hypothetical protein
VGIGENRKIRAGTPPIASKAYAVTAETRMPSAPDILRSDWPTLPDHLTAVAALAAPRGSQFGAHRAAALVTAKAGQ